MESHTDRKTIIACFRAWAKCLLQNSGGCGRGRTALQRDIPVLFLGAGLALIFQHLKRGDQAAPRFARQDDFVDESARSGAIRVQELFLVRFDEFRAFRGGVGRSADILPENDVDRAFSAHDCHFRGRQRTLLFFLIIEISYIN